MNEDKQNLYEGMYIISATLSEDARAKALDRIQSGITERGGEMVQVHDFGRKRMAYEVAGHREGGREEDWSPAAEEARAADRETEHRPRCRRTPRDESIRRADQRYEHRGWPGDPRTAEEGHRQGTLHVER